MVLKFLSRLNFVQKETMWSLILRCMYHVYDVCSMYVCVILQNWSLYPHTLMYSHGTYAAVKGHLELTLLRVVKDSTPSRRRREGVSWGSTPSRRRILRYTNFGSGESSPILFLDMMNLHLIIFEAWWILNERAFFIVLLFLYFKVNLDLEKQISLVNFHPTLILRGESWPNYFGKEVNWWWILT